MLPASLWLTSLLALAAVSDGACVQQQDQPRRRLGGSTVTTGRMSAHPPFRLFQALATRYEAAAELPVVDVAAFSSTVFSGHKLKSVAGRGADQEPTDDDDGFSFVAVRTHKPVPECTPRPKRQPRTPVSTEAVEGDRVQVVSRDQDSVETPSVSASKSQSDSDSNLAAGASAAITGFQPLSSANFTTSIIAGEATPSPKTPSPEPSRSVNAGRGPSVPALNATSSAPGGGNASSDTVPGATSQTGSPSNSVGSGGTASNPQISLGSSNNSTQPALGQPGSTPVVAGTLPCILISVEGDATYCVAPADPKSGMLSCSGTGSTQEASTSSTVGLSRTCPRKGDAAIKGCHPALRSFNTTTKTCIAPEDSRCIIIRTGVWGCSFSSSPSSDGQIMVTSTSNSSSIAVQTLSTSSSLAVNQTSDVVETTAGEEQQPQYQNASTVPGSLLIVAGVLAIALAVLAIVKRKRAQRKAPPLDQDTVLHVQESYLSYPKTPEFSKATESVHSFT